VELERFVDEPPPVQIFETMKFMEGTVEPSRITDLE
jgi:biotin/methionine sulfoxide reductase